MKPQTAMYPQAGTIEHVRARSADFVALTKPRLSSMSVITSLLGYFAALPVFDLSVFVNLFFGSTLTAAGAATLNMWMEREEDSRMQRTASRPLPKGRILPVEALSFGLLLSLLGCTVLYLGCGLLAALFGALTLAVYLIAYTPLKKISWLATEVGAISGALPPLIGWAAAGSADPVIAWYLFTILFVWQIPHFMSISWLYREDYRRGGYAMLSIRDESGKRVAQVALVYTILMCVVAPLPVAFGEASMLYAAGALGLSLWQAAAGRDFRHSKERPQAARRLFLRSVIYLPCLMLLFVMDRCFV